MRKEEYIKRIKSFRTYTIVNVLPNIGGFNYSY